jgi:hypothetical protein
MRLLSIVICVGSLSIGCSSSGDAPNGNPGDGSIDLPVPVSEGGAPPCPTSDAGGHAGLGDPCVTDSDCAPGTTWRIPDCAYNTRLCAYQITDGCSAQGHCADIPMPTCASFEIVCGCGAQVRIGCSYQSGYASGPTTGQTACADGGI